MRPAGFGRERYGKRGHFMGGYEIGVPSNRPSADHGGADKPGRMLRLQTLGGGVASIE